MLLIHFAAAAGMLTSLFLFSTGADVVLEDLLDSLSKVVN